MKRHGRRSRYRRSMRHKNGILICLPIALCTVITVVILFVIVGNALGKKVSQSEESRKSVRSTETETTTHTVPRSVNASSVPLSENGSNLEDRLKRAAEQGFDSACFELEAKDGSVLYFSDVAISAGYLQSDAKLKKLPSAMEIYKEGGLYSIGITYLSKMNVDDDLKRSMAAGYYASLCAESIRAGVDDVLLCPVGMPTDRYSELVGIAEEIHRLCDGSTVGVALPPSAVSADGGEALVDLLWSEFDYLAVDLTSAPAEGEEIPEKIDRELGGMLYYLLRYNMRALAPSTQDTALAEKIIEAIKSNGSQNIQFMP